MTMNIDFLSADQNIIGRKVFCIVKENSLSSLFVEENAIKDRDDGIYTVVNIWFPDTWHYPMIMYLECQDEHGTTFFTSDEVQAVLDDF